VCFHTVIKIFRAVFIMHVEIHVSLTDKKEASCSQSNFLTLAVTGPPLERVRPLLFIFGN
jgi:hypothetical protein